MPTSAGRTSKRAWRPTASAAALRGRADCLRRTRAFFAERGLLEVEVPVRQAAPNLDPGIRPLALAAGGWLITSPEHYLKRLLAAGHGDCWSLTPVFRAEEHGSCHREEFALLEWYRTNLDDRSLAEECVDLLEAVSGRRRPRRRTGYREACLDAVGLDPHAAGIEDWRRVADLAPADAARFSAAELRDWVFARRVEPVFDPGAWTVVTGFPAERAAQARLRPDETGTPVAARFEVHAAGMELANGYHELTDAAELRRRLAAEAAKASLPLPTDAALLAAMEHGLPDCAGVAVGFDRLVMLALGEDDIAAVRAFADL